MSATVGEDSELRPCEKQFSITGVKVDDRVRVHSEIASVSRRLLNHPHSVVERTREEDGTIVAVTATIPVSCVVIAAEGRQSEDWRKVVSEEVLRQ